MMMRMMMYSRHYHHHYNYVITIVMNVVVITIILLILPKFINTNAFILNRPVLRQQQHLTNCQVGTTIVRRRHSHQQQQYQKYIQSSSSSSLRYDKTDTLTERNHSILRLPYLHQNQKYRITNLQSSTSNSDRSMTTTTTADNNYIHDHDQYELYDMYTNVAVLDPDWFHEYIINIVGTNDNIVNHDFLLHVKQQQQQSIEQQSQLLQQQQTLQYQQELQSQQQEVDEQEQSIDSNTNQHQPNLVSDVRFNNTTTMVDTTLQNTTQSNVTTELQYKQEDEEKDDVKNKSLTTVLDYELLTANNNNEMIDHNCINSSLTIENNSIQLLPLELYVNDSVISNTITTSTISELNDDDIVNATLTKNNVIDLELEPIIFSEDNNITNDTNSTDAIATTTDTTTNVYTIHENVQLFETTTNMIHELFNETNRIQNQFNTINSTTGTTPTNNSNTNNISVKITNNNEDEDKKNNTSNVGSQQLSSSKQERRVVLYFKDSDDEQEKNSNWETVDITLLYNLGYTENEIITLQPTALHVIVSNQLQKPRTGIPKRWLQQTTTTNADNIENKNIIDENVVQIVNESVVADILKKAGETKSSRIPVSNATDPVVAEKRANMPPRKGIVTDPDNRNKQRTDMKQEQQQQKTERRRVNDYEKEKVESTIENRRRRRSQQQEPQSITERQIYSGRPTPKRRLNDDDTTMPLPPPLPKSSFWPDVETFQKLLRDEASFRLRILGSDWTNIVKEEIDWRNELYTNWIWTLHNGIGEPFVQSRSDRIRRQQRQQQKRRTTDDNSKSQRGPR